MYLYTSEAFVAQLAARRSHNPKVAGSIPVESSNLPVSLGGQDTRLSPERPGFNSRTGNFFLKFFFIKKNKTKCLGRDSNSRLRRDQCLKLAP